MTCPHAFSAWIEVSPRQQWLNVTHRLFWRECSLCHEFQRKSTKDKRPPDACPTLTEDDVEALP